MNTKSCLLFSLIASLCNGANILFYNSARVGQSHMFFMGRLADWLVEAGHNVTFYQQDLLENSSNTGTKLAHTVVRQKIPLERDDVGQSIYWLPFDEATFKFMKNYGYLQGVACESQLQDPELAKRLKNEKYDFAVIEYFDFCSYAMLEKAGIKKYATTSALIPSNSIPIALGVPAGLGVIPAWLDILSETPTFYERLLAMYNHIRGLFRLSKAASGRQIQAIKKYHDPHFNALHKIAGSSYIFVNIDEHLTFQQPISPKMIFLGSSDVKKQPEALSSDFKNIVDSAEQGVVVISLGSTVKSSEMPLPLKDALVETVKSFPDVSFIWKYEIVDEVGANLTNLYKRKWIPQHELFANPRVLAFVTHGGLNSLSETAEMGVPAICLPLCNDQAQNCQALQAHGIAIMIGKNCDARVLKQALEKVLNDESVRQKAKNMADLISHKPFSAKERFVRYIDHAIKFDVAEALDIKSRNHGLIRAHNLDYLLYFSVLLFAVLSVVYHSVKLTLRLFWRVLLSRLVTKTKIE
ncbi:unnamed protein product [Bursaphelenchus xylophilus]|uniref:glucuronosyltransferase n=1 Tax=Bursaphelenchus xylophilus TaxID=6326 RepID=A0A1I7RYH7_BURXY|nr:unnamed protein product [Bursaphelenchus xylophilus]CAG9092671.1 unnamed protein product [Bursaphelenchus xylophilus]